MVALVAGAATVAEAPVGGEATRELGMGLNPSLSGAVQEMVAWALAAAAEAAGGGPGVGEAGDAAPAPAALVATTEKVYAVPLVSPVRVAEVPVTVALAPAGLEVTV